MCAWLKVKYFIGSVLSALKNRPRDPKARRYRSSGLPFHPV
jgi:hypothetical protein